MAIKGKDLSITVGGTEYNLEVRSVYIRNEEAEDDETTFGNYGAGGARQWFVELEVVADYSASSFWDYLWTNSGEDAAVVVKPYGNATPTTAQPHFTVTATVGAKPEIGGSVGELFTFEYRMDCTEPVKVTA